MKGMGGEQIFKSEKAFFNKGSLTPPYFSQLLQNIQPLTEGLNGRIPLNSQCATHPSFEEL